MKKRMTFGALLTGRSPVILEDYANYGFDCLVVDYEHSELSFNDIHNLITNALMWETDLYLKVNLSEATTISRSLDSGVKGVIVSGIRNQGEAVKAVEIARFPNVKNGKRRFSRFTRAAGFGVFDFDPEEYLKQRVEKEELILDCDNREFVENAEAIVSLEGVSGIFFDVDNYLLSKGISNLNDYDLLQGELNETLKKLIRACKEHDKKICVPYFNPDRKTAETFENEGVDMLLAAADILTVEQSVKAVKDSLLDELVKTYVKE